jgi:ParB family transcriptional regulator, chromosome partitioning protein
MKKKSGLGRGLDALLGDALVQTTQEAQSQNTIVEIPLEQIQPGKYQPRTHFDSDKLKELAASIKAQGLVQPIVVRQLNANHYELIAGERRWRAAQIAELRNISAIVRVVPDQATIAMALIENIQREDLSPIEEAQSLKRLIDEFDLTHQSAADAIGRSRVAVSNLLRLLELAPAVRVMLEQGRLDMGHARALLSLDANKQTAIAQKAIDESWNVRQTESAVRQLLSPVKVLPSNKSASHTTDQNIKSLALQLSEKLAAKVDIEHAAGKNGRAKGRLVITYNSLDELDGILARIQ